MSGFPDYKMSEQEKADYYRRFGGKEMWECKDCEIEITEDECNSLNGRCSICHQEHTREINVGVEDTGGLR